MTDREMLEFAAKAAGHTVEAYSKEQGLLIKVRDGVSAWWNPQDNDGDALRLAVKLLIQVVQDRMGFVKVGWSVGFDSGTPSTDGRGPWYWKEWLSDHNGDRQAATRRAITQAAAGIGKAMP